MGKWSCSEIEDHFAAGLANEISGEIGLMPLEELITRLKQSEIILNRKRTLNHFKKKSVLKTENMTFESKRNLALALGNLSGEKLATIIDIVVQELKGSHLHSKSPPDELVFDIDMLSPKTLSRLNRLVKSMTVSAKKGKNFKLTNNDHLKEYAEPTSLSRGTIDRNRIRSDKRIS